MAKKLGARELRLHHIFGEEFKIKDVKYVKSKILLALYLLTH